MINEKIAIKFCKDFTKVENYEEAVNDQSQVWHCHHILGEILTRRQLLDHNFYYDVPPCMLKFVTGSEHMRLHNTGKHNSAETRRKMSEAKKGENHPLYGKHHTDDTRKKMSESHKGRTHTEETRRKMSEAKKGENHPLYGKHHTDDTRKKMSEALKGHAVTDETRIKISKANKGKVLSEETRRKISEALKRRKKF